MKKNSPNSDKEQDIEILFQCDNPNCGNFNRGSRKCPKCGSNCHPIGYSQTFDSLKEQFEKYKDLLKNPKT